MIIVQCTVTPTVLGSFRTFTLLSCSPARSLSSDTLMHPASASETNSVSFTDVESGTLPTHLKLQMLFSQKLKVCVPRASSLAGTRICMMDLIKDACLLERFD